MKNLDLIIELIAKEFNISNEYGMFTNNEKDVTHIFLNFDKEYLIYFVFKDNLTYDINGNYIDTTELYHNILKFKKTDIANDLLLNFLSYRNFYLKNENLELLDFPMNLDEKLSDETYDDAIGYKDYYSAFYILDKHITNDVNNHYLYKMRSNLLVRNDFTERALREIIFSFYLKPTDLSNIFDVYYNIALIYERTDYNIALELISTLILKIESFISDKKLNIFEFQQTSVDMFDTKCQEQEKIISLIEIYKIILFKKSGILSLNKKYSESNEALLSLTKLSNNIKYLYEIAVNFHNLGDYEFSKRVFNDVVNYKNGVFNNIGIDVTYIKKAKNYLNDYTN